MIWIYVLVGLALGMVVGFLVGRFKIKGFLPMADGLYELSGEIASSVDQMGSVSQEIVKASTDQLETLNSTVAASHEIRSMISRTSEHAGELDQDARKLMGFVESGSEAIVKMVSSSQDMKNGMADFTAQMNASIQELTLSLGVIQQIAVKTEVINEIVFQTRLLSFNASVEAARAGESGKGFSVVAEEIGKLALMSGNASKDISTIVGESLKVVETAISGTRDRIHSLADTTSRKSEFSFEQAKKCEETFKRMREQISETVGMIAQIMSATKEQEQGVGLLDQSITQFQEAADKNKLVASQAGEHGNEFAKTTGLLTNLVRKSAAHFGWFDLDARRHYKKFEWSDRLDLHVGPMDDEHKILVDRINDLVESLAANHQKPNPKHVQNAFTQLAQYTLEHFTDEEKYLASIGYPQLNSHKRIHATLLAQVAEFDRELKAGTLDDMKLIAFLRNWLISHIMGVDMQYSRFAHKQAA